MKHVLFTSCSLKSFAERKLFNSTRQKCLFNFMGGIGNIKKKICFLIMFKPDISYKRIGTWMEKTIVLPLPLKSQSAAHLWSISPRSTCTFSQGTLCIHNMNHHGTGSVSTMFRSKITKTTEAVIFRPDWWLVFCPGLKLSICLNLLKVVKMSTKMVDKWWDFPPEGLCSSLKKCIILISKREYSF